MKTSILALILIFVCSGLKAQDTVRVKVLGKNVVTVVEEEGRTDVKVGNNAIDIREGDGDTVKVRLGRKRVIITDKENGSTVSIDHSDDQSWTDHPTRFKGHWPAFEMGMNSFARVDYKNFTPNFMDLYQNKSYEVNINFLRYSIGLQKEKRNIGIVTGLGLSLNDYRFSNGYTIENENGIVKPVLLDQTGLSKTKLSTSYVSAPVMLEFQIPVNDQNKRIYISAGVIGGIKVGSHTKIKQNGDKTKNRDDFNINPFRYGASARLGYKGINIFGTYYCSPFFKEGRGPELYPFTIGIGLMNWYSF